MKSFLFLLAGITGAVAYMLIKQPKPTAEPLPNAINDLAHTLQDAWADHHTVA